MCGIAGIWHLDGRPVDPAALKRMADALAHRGPDGEGYRVDGDLGLAHRRLKIVDPGPQSHQPMADESGRYHIVYNGEIHTYVELRRELESAGATFRSAGDTEVALQAFLRWGDGCFDRFNGMWALAVWDARDRVLTLSRDRFGIKPLVISRRGARFAFASEPKAILAAFPEEHEPDLRELSGYAQGAVPDGTDATAFANIRAIPPDCVAHLGRHGERRSRFWSFSPREESPCRNAAEQLADLIDDATALRLRSDVPLGACLSGGMDSSAIVASAAPRMAGPLHCFSLLYPDEPCDESHFSRMAAEPFPSCRTHWVQPDTADILGTIGRIVWHHDAPAPLRGRYPQWFVFGEAARHVRVVLNGQGGDELLGGYPRFVPAYALDRLRGLPTGRDDSSSLAGDLSSLSQLSRLGPLYAAGTFVPPLLRRAGRGVRMSADVLEGDFRAAAGAFDPRRHFSVWIHPAAPRPFRSHLNNALWNEFIHAGLREVLHGEDALSMAWSIESRHPLLDHRLVEFCFRLPYGEKIAGGRTKDVMRRAVAGRVPAGIIARRDKMGFQAPMTAWLRRPDCMGAWRELLTDPLTLRRGVFNPPRLRRALDRFARDSRFAVHCTESLWRWINLALWFRIFA